VRLLRRGVYLERSRKAPRNDVSDRFLDPSAVLPTPNDGRGLFGTGQAGQAFFARDNMVFVEPTSKKFTGRCERRLGSKKNSGCKIKHHILVSTFACVN